MIAIFRNYIFTLLLLPIISLFINSEWIWRRSLSPVSVKEVSLESDIPKTTERRFWLFSEGTQWDFATLLDVNKSLDVSYDRTLDNISLELQADFNDEYLVEGSADGSHFQEIWRVPAAGNKPGLRTRKSPLINLANQQLRYLRIRPLSGDNYYSVSWLQVWLEPVHISKRTLPFALCFTLVLCLIFARKLNFKKLEQVLSKWHKLEPIIAALTIYLLIFNLNPTVVLSFLSFAFLYICAVLVQRLSIAFIAVAAITIAVSWYSCSRFLQIFLISQISRSYTLSVDHRLRPNSSEDVNSDGIRFKGEASNLAKGDFNIAFLGDSFTYGYKLKYEETFPYQFEKIAKESNCRQNIRAVNFGWTSSSPLLSLRLLSEIGNKYQPNLLVYTLDMTDFSDDLNYAVDLEHQKDFKPDTGRILERFLLMKLPWLRFSKDDISAIKSFFQPLKSELSWINGAKFNEHDKKHGERFFVTNYPLSETKTEIENGVMKNLLAINKFSSELLKAKMALVLAPRAYQYSSSESKENYEKAEYPILGPYVLEPFKYFDQVKATLPYPVISLLEDFNNSTEFPLYFNDDPHWNPKGARLAAQSIFDKLVAQEMIPCQRP